MNLNICITSISCNLILPLHKGGACILVSFFFFPLLWKSIMFMFITVSLLHSNRCSCPKTWLLQTWVLMVQNPQEFKIKITTEAPSESGVILQAWAYPSWSVCQTSSNGSLYKPFLGLRRELWKFFMYGVWGSLGMGEERVLFFNWTPFLTWKLTVFWPEWWKRVTPGFETLALLGRVISE